MKLIKLNRKHALHHKWKFALMFGTTINANRNRSKYSKMFEKMYGPDREFNPEYTVFGNKPNLLYNKNWYNDQYRGRIYFNNESDITAITLLMA